MELIEKEIDTIIENYSQEKLSQNDSFYFIQVGSNDGQTGDPIFKFVKKYSWQGILVEPVPYLFEKLKSTYKDYSGLSFENSAIDKEDGHRTFYRVKENNNPNNPIWYDQLGSFRKEIVEKHKEAIPEFDAHLITEEVSCISFANLLKKYSVNKIDLLHIDTEGYDYEIIKLIPFETTPPQMIMYEHKHLGKHDQEECKKLLLGYGYHLLETESDTFVYLK